MKDRNGEDFDDQPKTSCTLGALAAKFQKVLGFDPSSTKKGIITFGVKSLWQYTFREAGAKLELQYLALEHICFPRWRTARHVFGSVGPLVHVAFLRHIQS